MRLFTAALFVIAKGDWKESIKVGDWVHFAHHTHISDYYMTINNYNVAVCVGIENVPKKKMFKWKNPVIRHIYS